MIDEIRSHIDLYLRHNPDELSRTQPLLDQLDRDGDLILERSNMNGHITISVFVLSHDLHHGLIILHKQLGLWFQPGGHYEPGDLSLLVAAMREVKEETGLTGISFALTYPLDIDTHPIPARPSKNEGEHQHHDLVYLAYASINEPLIAQEEEVDGVKWVPLEELKESHSRMQILTQKVLSFIESE